MSTTDPRPATAAPLDGDDVLQGRAVSVEYHRGRPQVTCHYHRLCELVFVRGAMGSRIVGDRLEDVSGRDLILVGPGLPHGWSVAPQVPREEAGVEFVVVLFTRQSLGLELLARPECAPIGGLIDRAARGLTWGPDVPRIVEQQIFSLWGLEPLGRLTRLLEVLGRLAELPARDLVSPAYRPHDAQRTQAAMASVLELVRRRHGEAIRLADAAGVAGMTVPTFTRFFRQMAGASFVDYLNEYRIRRACDLLRHTCDRVQDIAAACGLANLSHFNRQFSRRRGLTPLQYRRGGSSR